MNFSKSFASDNAAGIHPEILKAITEVNQGHCISYGMDELTLQLKAEFTKKFGGPLDMYLVFNGTAANTLGLSALLRPHEAILASDCSHLHLDECGAPEKWTGSKILTVPTQDGKIELASLENFLERMGDQHAVQPKVLSITQPTEMGTVYSLKELKELSSWSKKHKMYLHMDGARFVNAANYLKVDFKTLTRDVGVDVLSFGGTKNGLMLGEAVLFFNSELAQNFKYIRKQGLQLASKHRFLSAQFLAYLKNDLCLEIADHSHKMSKLLEQELKKIPQVEIPLPVQSNGVFASFPRAWLKPLKDHTFFYVWTEKPFLVRLMTSFDTTEEDVLSFIKIVRELSN